MACGVQQPTADAGRGEHRHDADRPDAHPGLVGRLGLVQGQQRRLDSARREARRPSATLLGLPFLSLGRLQALQVRRVFQLPRADDRRRQRQRGLQVSQFGGYRGGPFVVGQAGPVREEPTASPAATRSVDTRPTASYIEIRSLMLII